MTNLITSAQQARDRIVYQIDQINRLHIDFEPSITVREIHKLWKTMLIEGKLSKMLPNNANFDSFLQFEDWEENYLNLLSKCMKDQ